MGFGVSLLGGVGGAMLSSAAEVFPTLFACPAEVVVAAVGSSAMVEDSSAIVSG